MELHPYLPQTAFVDWHKQHGIHVTAYSPFGNANPTYGSNRKQNAASAVPPLLGTPQLAKIAKKVGCTQAQTALAWGMQRGTSVIPKSSHQSRIKENFGASHCKLSAADVKTLETALPVKRFNNPSKSWGIPLYDGLEDAGRRAVGGDASSIFETVEDAKEAAIGWSSQLWKMISGW